MYLFVYWLITTLHVIAIPVAGMGAIFAYRRRRDGRVLLKLLFPALAGVLVAITIHALYALITSARILPFELLLTAALVASSLLILRGMDHVVLWVLVKLLRLGDDASTDTRWSRLRRALASVVRVTLLFAVIIPSVMASALVYRPKLDARAPSVGSDLFQTTRVEFSATDGTRLTGWWSVGASQLSSASQPSGASGADWSVAPARQTVLLCSGWPVERARFDVLRRTLLVGGYNVLTVDLRATGASAGRLSTLGDTERFDVLGAVRWLREHRPDQSIRIVGVGASIGGAALLGATRDAGDGQLIDAVVVYGTGNRLVPVVQDWVSDRFMYPTDVVISEMGLRVASALVGRDLRRVAPEEDAAHLWPRPLLVVHGMRDDVIKHRFAEKLLDAAMQPKYYFWLPDASAGDTLRDDVTANVVRAFFDVARPVL